MRTTPDCCVGVTLVSEPVTGPRIDPRNAPSKHRPVDALQLGPVNDWVSNLPFTFSVPGWAVAWLATPAPTTATVATIARPRVRERAVMGCMVGSLRRALYRSALSGTT
jgi:hypothetical protein